MADKTIPAIQNLRGNIGIGTASPSTPLHVKGNIRAEASGSTAFADLKSSQIYASSTYDLIVGTNNPLFFRTNDTRRMTILGGGNVGIGTTTPSSLLNLSDASNNLSHQIGFSYVSGGTETDAFTIGRNNSTGNLEFHSDINNHGFEFKHNAAGTQEFNILNMKVGIGTDAPSYNLDIEELSSNAGVAVRLREPAGRSLILSSPSHSLSPSGSAFIGTDTNHHLTLQGGVTNAGLNYIQFKTAGANQMRLTHEGRLGIGTTGPAEKLDVKGTAKIGGNSTTNCHLIGSKGYSLTASFTTGLTVSLPDHNACHVKVFISGDWSNHSSVAYVGEFLIQNTGNVGSYNEPGIILTEYDNLTSDRVAAKIVDGTSDDFEIQFQAVSSSATGIPISAKITYHVMGDATSVS